LNKSGVLNQADFAQLMRDPERRDAQCGKSTHGEKPSEIDVINHLSLRVQSREHLLRTAMKKTHASVALDLAVRGQRRPEGQKRGHKTAPE